MPWYAIRPRDPADPRWPLPETQAVTLKADHPEQARERFEEAYPSNRYGTPATPVPDRGAGSFRGDAAALIVEETDEPPPKDS